MRPIEREQLAVLQQTRIRGVYGSRRYANLIVIDKENGRKADAVNAGLGFAAAPLVCVIDADSIIEPAAKFSRRLFNRRAFSTIRVPVWLSDAV